MQGHFKGLLSDVVKVGQTLQHGQQQGPLCAACKACYEWAAQKASNLVLLIAMASADCFVCVLQSFNEPAAGLQIAEALRLSFFCYGHVTDAYVMNSPPQPKRAKLKTRQGVSLQGPVCRCLSLPSMASCSRAVSQCILEHVSVSVDLTDAVRLVHQRPHLAPNPATTTYCTCNTYRLAHA